MVSPELVATHAQDLTSLGSMVDAAHLAAVAPTTSLVPAAADEVSTAVTAMFSQFGATYHQAANQAGAFFSDFVHKVNTGALTYAAAEVGNAGHLGTSATAPMPANGVTNGLLSLALLSWITQTGSGSFNPLLIPFLLAWWLINTLLGSAGISF